MIINVIKKILFKINLIRFCIQTYQYRIHIGNYVNFVNDGKLIFKSRNITIRDFSEIVVYAGGTLTVADNVFIGKNVEVGAHSITVGQNTSIQNNCILLGRISVGRDCLFGPSVYVSSGFHYFRYRPALLIRDQDVIASNALDLNQNRIVIEDDVWIGKDVVIMNNVVIGKGSVIGANSVINKSVAPYTIVAGTPQKVIGMRLDFELNIPNELNGSSEQHFPYFYKGFDYSVRAISKNKFVSVMDRQVTICIKNTGNKKYLVMEFASPQTNDIVFQDQRLSAGSGKVKFDVSNHKDTKYSVDVEGRVSELLVKKIFFDD